MGVSTHAQGAEAADGMSLHTDLCTCHAFAVVDVCAALGVRRLNMHDPILASQSRTVSCLCIAMHAAAPSSCDDVLCITQL